MSTQNTVIKELQSYRNKIESLRLDMLFDHSPESFSELPNGLAASHVMQSLAFLSLAENSLGLAMYTLIGKEG